MSSLRAMTLLVQPLAIRSSTSASRPVSVGRSSSVEDIFARSVVVRKASIDASTTVCPSSALRIDFRNSSGSMSLRKYPSAPAWMQAVRSLPESLTVRTTMRRDGSSSLSVERISTPEQPFILRSRIVRSGSVRLTSLIASSRVPASPTTSSPCSRSRSSRTPRRKSGWSSMIAIVWRSLLVICWPFPEENCIL